jgi:hypothetical protein
MRVLIVEDEPCPATAVRDGRDVPDPSGEEITKRIVASRPASAAASTRHPAPGTGTGREGGDRG